MISINETLKVFSLKFKLLLSSPAATDNPAPAPALASINTVSPSFNNSLIVSIFWLN